MRYKPEVKALVTWLRIEGHSAAQLAVAMGYKSSTTINKWISQNCVPPRQRQQLMKIIEKTLPKELSID